MISKALARLMWNSIPLLIFTVFGTACTEERGVEKSEAADESSRVLTEPVPLPDGAELVADSSVGYPDAPLLEVREDLRIGAANGPMELEFFRLRSIQVDEAGTIYVGSEDTGEIRVFASDGRFVRSIGKLGDGPGEYRTIRRMFWQGESLVVEDARLWRVTKVARSGELLATWSSLSETVPIPPQGANEDGYVVQLASSTPRTPEPGDVHRGISNIGFVHGKDGYPIDSTSLRTPTPTPILRYARQRSFDVMLGDLPAYAYPLWEPEPTHAVDGAGAVYLHFGSPYVIDRFDYTGRLTRRIARHHNPVRITADLVQRYRKAGTAAARNSRSINPEMAVTVLPSVAARADLPHVEHLPALGQILVSRGGTIWVERPDLVADPLMFEVSSQRSAFWDIFESNGAFRGTVEFPNVFTPLVVTEDAAIGVARDEFGIEYVVRFVVDD